MKKILLACLLCFCGSVAGVALPATGAPCDSAGGSRRPIWVLNPQHIWEHLSLINASVERAQLAMRVFRHTSDWNQLDRVEEELRYCKMLIGMPRECLTVKHPAGMWECVGLTNSEIEQLFCSDYDDSVGLPNLDRPMAGDPNVGASGSPPRDSNPDGPGVHAS